MTSFVQQQQQRSSRADFLANLYDFVTPTVLHTSSVSIVVRREYKSVSGFAADENEQKYESYRNK